MPGAEGGMWGREADARGRPSPGLMDGMDGRHGWMGVVVGVVVGVVGVVVGVMG